MRAGLNPIASRANYPLDVHFQSLNRCSTYWCFSVYLQTLIRPLEMLMPRLLTGVEQNDDRFSLRIEGRCDLAFTQVAA